MYIKYNFHGNNLHSEENISINCNQIYIMFIKEEKITLSECSPFTALYLGFIGMDCVSKLFYKEKILQRNYWKMTIGHYGHFPPFPIIPL